LTKKVYVGNLSFDATEQQVRDLFSEFGKIESIAMINDRDTGRFRGFCFVEMEDSAAVAAINALNGKVVDDRDLRVNEARPREERSGGGGNRSGGSRGGGSRGGGSRGSGGNRRDSYGGGGSSRDNYGGGSSRDNYGGGNRW
jgi:RNA recognition motif-containing protein